MVFEDIDLWGDNDCDPFCSTTMSSVPSEAHNVVESGIRYGQKPSQQTSKASSVLRSRKASSSRGLLRGSSSLWWVGRKYHRLDQPNDPSDNPNDTSSDSSTEPSPINNAETVSPPKKSGRRIHWNERVRVRRFEKINPELIRDCYYSEAELYSFHREYAMEDDMDFPDDQDDEQI